MADPRIESVIRSLFMADLEGLSATSKERPVARQLSAALTSLPRIEDSKAMGIDGTMREPDHSCTLPTAGQCGALKLAIEYKLYRNRKLGAGEMDRGLGQCIAYAEQYDAVLFFVVYMNPPPPQCPIPKHWLDRAVPLRVGHDTAGATVPVYFAVRPRSWNDNWAGLFTR